MIEGLFFLFVAIWILVVSPTARLAFVIFCGIVGVTTFLASVFIPEIAMLTISVAFSAGVAGIIVYAIVRAERGWWRDPPEADEPPYLRDPY